MPTMFRLAAVLALVAHAPRADAVPPLVIGDVPTADPGQAEWYVGVAWQRDDTTTLAAPITELVVGLTSWQEVTVEAPYLVLDGAQGVGDVVLGTKVRLLEEKAGHPGLALSAEWSLANGDAARGLGSGAMELEFRLRTQRTWGRFTLLANAAYALLGDPTVGGVTQHRRNIGFLGLGQELVLRAGLTLVADQYWRSSPVAGDAARVAGDIGLKLQLRPTFSIQAAAGTSLRPDRLAGPDLRLYGGLKWEFGLF